MLLTPPPPPPPLALASLDDDDDDDDDEDDDDTLSVTEMLHTSTGRRPKSSTQIQNTIVQLLIGIDCGLRRTDE